jgi:hypothetical protein
VAHTSAEIFAGGGNGTGAEAHRSDHGGADDNAHPALFPAADWFKAGHPRR